MDTNDLAAVRRTLWSAADQMRANSTLGPSEYRGPVLGLIFLAYAEHRFEEVRPELAHATLDPRQCSVCARGGVRTRTLLRGGGFKPPASANSASRAGVGSMLSHTSRERLRSNY